jgi:bifunctional ADP-heptose synthase (sugar kinase/adenylyltransferase)
VPEPSCQPSLGLLRPDTYVTVKEDWAADYKESKEYKTVTKYGGQVLVVERQSSKISTSQIIQRAIGGSLSDILKDFMQYRKDPLKE